MGVVIVDGVVVIFIISIVGVVAINIVVISIDGVVIGRRRGDDHGRGRGDGQRHFGGGRDGGFVGRSGRGGADTAVDGVFVEGGGGIIMMVVRGDDVFGVNWSDVFP